ncbi:hypothetical protein PMAYCL1PPCAC_04837, partial [Pristionchus mayeri]
LGRLIIATQGIRKTGIGIAEDVLVRVLGHGFHEWSHFLRSKRTIQSDCHSLTLPGSNKERFSRLSGEGSSREIDNCSGKENGNFQDVCNLKYSSDSKECRLGVG